MMLYKAENLRSWRQLALGPCRKVQIEYATIWDVEIHHWIDRNWAPHMDLYGLTREVMRLLIWRWAFTYKSAWGFSMGGSLTLAYAKMKAFISASAAAVAVPALTLWVGIMLIEPVIALADLFMKHYGINVLPEHAAILRYRERLWWAGVYSHPLSRVWHIIQGAEIPAAGFLELRRQYDIFGIHDEWHFHELWLECGKGVVYHYGFGRTEMRTVFVGKAEKRADLHYGYVQRALKPWPWSLPVGFRISRAEALAYSTTLHDDFKV